jgi:hypothetical protein
MRNNQIIFILVGVFFLMTLATAVLSYRFINSVRTLESVQQRLSVLNYTEGFLKQLGAETGEYAKKDPGVLTVLQPANAAATLPPPAAK